MKFLQHIRYISGWAQVPAVTRIKKELGYRAGTLISIRLYTASEKHKSADNTEKIESKPKKLKKPKSNATSNILGSLEDPCIQELKDVIPAKLLNRKRSTPELYLINKDTAHDILYPILPYLRTESSIKSSLIEINPGLGFLTELLLENWSREISLFEFMRNFAGPINNPELSENHLSRITLRYINFYELWSLAYQDKHDNGTRITELFCVEPKPWSQEFSTTIIGSAPSSAFMRHLAHSIIFQYSLMMLGRHQMFFVVTPKQYIQLTCNRKAGYRQYRIATIMFQMLFEFKMLCKLPRKSFLPPARVPKKTRTNTISAKINNMDSEYLYLMRIAPRADIYDKCKREDLKYLWYFIKANCFSRKNRVIPSLERLVPNCGPRLINNPYAKPAPAVKTMEVDDFHIPLESAPLCDTDYYQKMTIFTEYGDLSPSQLLTLFKQFRSWPEFSDSTFQASMENFLQRVENSEEIIDDVDEDEIEEEGILIKDP